MKYIIKGVVLHWTASKYDITESLKHYNFVYDQHGGEHAGRWSMADQMPPLLGGSKPRYAAHTLRYNSYQAGLGLLGMHGAKERPFNAGRYPITEVSFMAAVDRTATICIDHRITVTKNTVLTHAEVQRNLGIKQRGKWDIANLPWDSSIVGATEVGNHYRNLVRAEMAQRLAKPTKGLWAAIFKAIAAIFGGKK